MTSKLTLFLSAAFFLLSIHSYSQCDSVRVSETMTIHDWDTTYTQEVIHYSSTGEIISRYYYSREDTLTPFNLSYFYTYQYDSNDSLISVTTSQSNSWSSDVQYTYNSSGQIVAVIRTNHSAGITTILSADSMQFDINGNLTDSVHYTGSTMDDKYSYNYDAGGHRLNEFYLSWNGASWDSITHTIFFYSGVYPDSALLQNYSNGWNDSVMTTFIYGVLPGLPDTTIIYLYDNGWNNYLMYHYTYGALNKVTHTYSLYWADTTWIYSSLIVNDVDANGNIIYANEYNTEYYSDGTFDWYSLNGASYYNYDSAGNLLGGYGDPIAGGPYNYNYNYVNGVLVSANGHSETMGGFTTDWSSIYYYTLITGDSVFCGNGSVTLYADSCPGNTFLWSDGQTTNSITVTAPGTYQVLITHPNGYSAYSAPYNVYQYNFPPVVASGIDSTITRCSNNTLSLNSASQSGVQYNWYRNDTLILSSSNASLYLSFNNVHAGNYYMIATNACGSDTSSATTVNLLPAPTVSITLSGPAVFCAGGSVTLTASPGFTYSWSTGATTQSIVVTNGNNYNLTVTDTQGCTATAHQTVMVRNFPAAPLIFASAGILSSNYSNGIFQWFLDGDTIPGATQYSYTPAVTGNYMLAYSNAGYSVICASYSNILFFNPVALSVEAGSDADICQNLSVNVGLANAASGGYPPYNYQWSPSALFVNANLLNAQTTALLTDTTLYLTVTDSTGNASTDSLRVHIHYPSPVPLSQTFTGGLCQGEAGIISLNVQNSYTMNWFINGDSIHSPYPSIWVSDAGIYQAQYRDGFGCITLSLPDTVIRFPHTYIPAVSVLPDTNICLSGNSTMFIHPHPGQTYEWWQDPPYVVAGTDTIFQSSVPASYTLSITDSNGCQMSENISFDQSGGSFTFDIISNDFYLCNPYQTLQAPLISGFSYQWFFNNIIIPTAVSANVIADSAGIYSCIISGPNGCTGSGIYTLSDSPLLTVNIIEQGNSLIANSSQQLVTWKWYLGGVLVDYLSNPGFNPPQPGIYTVVVTNQYGCSVSGTINYPQCIVSLSSPNTVLCSSICTGILYANVNGIPPFQLNWSTGDTAMQLFNQCTGQYIATLTDSAGCITHDSINIIRDSISISTTVTNPTCAGCSNGEILISVQNASVYNLTITPFTGTFAGNIVTNLPAGVYYVCAFDTFNCITCVYDTLADPPSGMNGEQFLQPTLLPTIVSDKFSILNAGKFEDFRMTIWDGKGSMGIIFHEYATTFSAAALKPGIYFVALGLDEKQYFFKLIKTE
jgi:hypothetical protein